jgi:hypothetical protein
VRRRTRANVRAWIPAALLAASLLGVRQDAQALVRSRTSTDIGIYWNRTPVVLFVDATPMIPVLSPEEALSAVRAAATRWSQTGNTCTSFVLDVQTREGRNTEAVIDGENRLVVRGDSWCNPRKTNRPCYDSSVLAVTTVTSRGSDGVILDADVELNATNLTWRDVVNDAAPDGSGHDLEAALTHELGHLAGFDHTCVPEGQQARLNDDGNPVPTCEVADPAAQISIMYPFEATDVEPRRALTVEDMRDQCRAYPRLPDTITGDGSTGCAIGGPPPSAALPMGLGLCALVLCSRRARRSR